VIVQGDDKRGRSIASDSAETLLLKVIISVLGLGASVLISRGLGPDGRGAFTLPIVVAGTAVAAGKLGLEQANVFLLGTERLSVRRLSGQNGLVALVMGVLGVLGMQLAAPAFPSLFADIPFALVLLAGLTIPFSLHAQFSAGLLTLLGCVTWQFWASCMAGLMQVGLLLGLFFSRWFAVGPILAVNLAAVALTWALTVGRFERGERLRVVWDPALLGHTLRQSLFLHLGMVLLFLHFRLDMFMIKGMAGTTALGHYSLSVALAETVLLATDSLAIAVLPRQMGTTIAEAAGLALQGARVCLLLGVGLAALWTVLGTAVIGICFGGLFAPAYPPLVGLLPGMVFLGMQRMCGGPTLRAGEPARITAIYAFSLLVNGALNLWWIPVWGPLGAALASSVSYGVGAALFLAWTARVAGVRLVRGVIPTGADLASVRRAVGEGVRALQQACVAAHHIR
jgi:O-antigen/teichoic acid export membrane protein